MRTALQTLVRVAALAGPTALAFASGGFFGEARLVALVVACGLLAGWAFAGRAPFPRGAPALLAVGGLGAYCAWVAASLSWAPLADVAHADLERVLIYLAGLLLGASLWRPRPAARAVEPALALGATVVLAYGLAGRLLPGIVHLATGFTAGSRLDQPLTYWNATGALAAIGFVLCARLAGDPTRPGPVRALAAGGAVPLGTGLYLTFSRGALAALAGGLVILLALAPTWSQLRAIALTLETAAAGVVVVRLLPGVNDLRGGLGAREADGAVALAVLLALALVAAAAGAWAGRVEADGRTRTGRLPLPRRSGRVAAIAALGLLVVPVAAAGTDHGPTASPAFGETTARLSSIGSNRYRYWDVAMATFADHPLRGVGTGGFRVEWLRRRTIDETVRDAHSLELETLAELGLIGLLALGAAFAGVGLAARSLRRADPILAAGPIAALAVWALHSAIDWDWEMPALTLVAVALSGLLLSGAARVQA